YSSYPDGTLWRSKVDGTGRLRLSSPSMAALQPKWSPDGKKIAFAPSGPGKPNHIYTVSADGGVPKELTKGDRDEVFPNWSPDGNSLIFGNTPSELAGGAPAAPYLLYFKNRPLSTFRDSKS